MLNNTTKKRVVDNKRSFSKQLVIIDKKSKKPIGTLKRTKKDFQAKKILARKKQEARKKAKEALKKRKQGAIITLKASRKRRYLR